MGFCRKRKPARVNLSEKMCLLSSIDVIKTVETQRNMRLKKKNPRKEKSSSMLGRA